LEYGTAMLLDCRKEPHLGFGLGLKQAARSWNCRSQRRSFRALETSWLHRDAALVLSPHWTSVNTEFVMSDEITKGHNSYSLCVP
jgi:hypothetical protein